MSDEDYDRFPFGTVNDDYRSRFEGIVLDPEIMGGAPTIEGSRVTVTMILDALSDGVSEFEILEAYPYLTSAQVRRALHFAAETIRNAVLTGAP